MPSTTLSPKYKIVIPKGVRQILALKPGQRLSVTELTAKLKSPPSLNRKSCWASFPTAPKFILSANPTANRRY